jgi:putative oxidoreductase
MSSSSCGKVAVALTARTLREPHLLPGIRPRHDLAAAGYALWQPSFRFPSIRQLNRGGVLDVNIALLVLRLVPGLLFMGHGLQKLVPPNRAPKFLAANGLRGTGAFFDQAGMRPGLLMAFVAGAAELVGGISIAAGLLTPVGTALIAGVMTVAILRVHASKGLWNSDGGIEFPLLMLTAAYAVSAIGPGSLSIDSWAGVANWSGIHWSAGNAVRAGVAVGIGVLGGLLALGVSRLRLSRRERQRLSPAH